MPTKSNNIGGRGGARPGAGRKKSAVKEKANNGNPGGRRLEVLGYSGMWKVWRCQSHMTSCQQNKEMDQNCRHPRSMRRRGSG